MGKQAVESFTPRFLADADEEALLDVLTASFGRWPAVEVSVSPMDHLRWKLRRDAKQPPLHSVIAVDSRVVAADTTFVHEFKAKGRVLRVFETNDACVHPDYRRRGLFRSLRQLTMQQIGSTMDLHISSNHTPQLAGVVEARDKRRPIANVVQVLIRPLTFMARSKRANEDRNGRPLLHILAYVWAIGVRLACWRPWRSHPSWSLRTTPSFDDRIDVFGREAETAFDFIALRRMDYLNWRYADIRGGDFSVTLAEEDDRILGYSVLRVSGGRARIAGLLALPGRSDVAASLVDDIVRRARSTGASAIECWLPRRHPYRGLLRRAGFFRAAAAAYRYEPTTAPETAVNFLDDPDAAIHLMLGDTDLV